MIKLMGVLFFSMSFFSFGQFSMDYEYLRRASADLRVLYPQTIPLMEHINRNAGNGPSGTININAKMGESNTRQLLGNIFSNIQRATERYNGALNHERRAIRQMERLSSKSNLTASELRRFAQLADLVSRSRQARESGQRQLERGRNFFNFLRPHVQNFNRTAPSRLGGPINPPQIPTLPAAPQSTRLVEGAITNVRNNNGRSTGLTSYFETARSNRSQNRMRPGGPTDYDGIRVDGKTLEGGGNSR